MREERAEKDGEIEENERRGVRSGEQEKRKGSKLAQEKN